MNKIIKIITSFFCVSIFIPYQIFAQSSSFELGTRYIKLSNTYREVGDFDKAIEYIEKGKRLIGRNDYWLAVTKEYYGYILRDIGKQKTDIREKKMFYQNALDSFNEALAIYKRIIFQPDGSPLPLEAMLKNINDLVDELDSINNDAPIFQKSAIAGEKVLNFDRQKLKNLPSDIPQNSKSISLAYNRFNQFPDGITKFTNLEYLDLSNNRIKNVSTSIGDLDRLHYLDLSNNRITNLSSSIGGLYNLVELNLENNRLKDLPATICNLKNLEILNIRNNKIPFEKISNIIKCLPKCNVLYDEYILKPKQVEEYEE